MGFSANAIDIRDPEAEIDIDEVIIQGLRDKQRSLRAQRNSILPFFCLPFEICIVIFSLACHEGRPLEQREMPLVTTPFLVSSVCHGWRVMARSAPELWCSVSLCVRPYFDHRSKMQAELLDQWLRLAKSLPLSIAMTYDPNEALKYEDEYFLTTLAAITPVVTSRSHQWQSLDLFLPFPWAETFESEIGHVPNLKSLGLHIDTEGWCDSSELSKMPFSTTFRDAPKLRTVTLGHENINVELPYHQLEELTFWKYSHDPTAVAFLSKCTNLKVFSADYCWLARDASLASVHLSKLVSLEIISTPQQLLGCLVAPSLASVTIPLTGPDEIEAFLAFLTRSDMTLKHLSIVRFVPREEKLLWKIFDALPNLSHLEINEPLQSVVGPGGFESAQRWLPSQRFFDYFSTPNITSGGLPLPHLKSFKYRGELKLHASMPPGNADSGNGVYVDTLERMFLARWNIGLPVNSGASRLQTFSMSITDSSRSVTMMEQSLVVKELRKEGMQLVFKYVKPLERMELEECW